MMTIKQDNTLLRREGVKATTSINNEMNMLILGMQSNKDLPMHGSLSEASECGDETKANVKANKESSQDGRVVGSGYV